MLTHSLFFMETGMLPGQAKSLINGMTRLGQTILELPNGITVDVHNASFTDYMLYYDVTLMNPKVLSGMFLGSMMAFLNNRALAEQKPPGGKLLLRVASTGRKPQR